jgi:hypothetical protein
LSVAWRSSKCEFRAECSLDEEVHPAQPVREVLALLADERELVAVLREKI